MSGFVDFQNIGGANLKQNIWKSMWSLNFLISSFDSIDEQAIGLTFMMRERWQDPRMMFPDIEGEPTVDEKTILTMDIRFLEELWLPGIDHELYQR